jgi:hypothetical protein
LASSSDTWRTKHAAILLDANQAGLVERAERLAHRPARDAERGWRCRLVELGTDRDLARR